MTDPRTLVVGLLAPWFLKLIWRQFSLVVKSKGPKPRGHGQPPALPHQLWDLSLFEP